MRKSLLSIGLLSFMLLAVQIALIQSLSFVQGHHLAYVVLSVALLGFGAGGALLTLLRNLSLQRLDRLYLPMASLAGVSVAWLPRLSSGILGRLEVDLLFTGIGPWLQLALLGTQLCIPFCAGAFALTIAFRTKADRIGQVYAANLAGSALGTLVVIPLMQVALPEQLLPFLGLLGIVSALLYGRGYLLWKLACAVLVCGALLTSAVWEPSQYQDLAYALQLPEVAVQGPHPHFQGRVDEVQAPALRFAPDISLQYRGSVPSPPHFFVNGNRRAVLLDPDVSGKSILAYTPQGVPFALGSYEAVLFLEPDSNAAVFLAAAERESAVSVVVSHPLLARRFASALPAQAQLYRSDARGFLAAAREQANDLVVFPMRGLFGGPTGLQTLGGDALFTVQSLQQAFDMLSDSGWLAFPVWLDDPLRHSLRVLALIREGLLAHGVREVEEHVLILRGWGSVYFMASRAPIRAETLARARDFAAQHGFDLIHPHADGTTMHHGPVDAPPALWFRSLVGPDADAFIADYRFDIRAPTDARPFFDQFIRAGDWGRDLGWLSVSERGMTVLYILLLQLAGAVLLIVFLPLLPLRRDLAGGAGTIGYFSGLGAGFMLYEVALIQLLIPLWGDPVTGAALVICTLLLGMACGSCAGTHLPGRLRDTGVLSLLAGVVLLVVGLGVQQLVRLAMPWNAGLRLLIIGPVLFLSAIILGMPFPNGIRFLRLHAPRQIPWACGIDGGVAVLAAPAAAVLAFYFGYPRVILLGACAYGFSMLAAYMGWRGRLGDT